MRDASAGTYRAEYARGERLPGFRAVVEQVLVVIEHAVGQVAAPQVGPEPLDGS